MTKFPISMMFLCFITAGYLWFVGSYNAAVMVAALGLFCGVAALVTSWIDK